MAAAGVAYKQKPKLYGRGSNTIPGVGSKNLLTENANRSFRSNARPPTVPNVQSIVELKVPLCCQGCAENVRFELTSLDGVNEISVDVETQRVVVKGDIQASIILKSVKRVENRAELWKN